MCNSLVVPPEYSGVLLWGYPAGGANLEATGEEFQSCIELSVVVEALQRSQTLQTYLALLQDRRMWEEMVETHPYNYQQPEQAGKEKWMNEGMTVTFIMVDKNTQRSNTIGCPVIIN